MGDMKTSRPELKSLFVAAAICAGLILMLGLTRVVADEDYTLAKKLRDSGQILSLEKIVERARAEKPGEVLETELETKHGRYIYEIEILDAKGQVWELKLDAKTGTLVKIERDD